MMLNSYNINDGSYVLVVEWRSYVEEISLVVCEED